MPMVSFGALSRPYLDAFFERKKEAQDHCCDYDQCARYGHHGKNSRESQCAFPVRLGHPEHQAHGQHKPSRTEQVPKLPDGEPRFPHTKSASGLKPAHFAQTCSR